MKVRMGFVSNSSSSSFIAVGLSRYGKNREKFDKIVEALAGCPVKDITYEILEKIWYSNGVCGADGMWLYTTDAEPFFVGLDMVKYIKADKTFSEAKKEFKQLVKDKLNINVSMNSMELEVGETSSG